MTQNIDDDDERLLNEGDSVYALIASTDKDVYTDYYSIKTAPGNNSNHTVLFTPKNALQQLLLGYFSVQTAVKASAVEFNLNNIATK